MAEAEPERTDARKWKDAIEQRIADLEAREQRVIELEARIARLEADRQILAADIPIGDFSEPGNAH